MSRSDTLDPAASLRRLSWCFYILAGLDVATAMLFANVAQQIRDGAGSAALAAEPGQLMNLTIALCTLMVVVNAVFALLHVLMAMCVHQHRLRRLCVGVSALSCMLVPFGTIAGVYALTILRKPPVKALFASSR